MTLMKRRRLTRRATGISRKITSRNKILKTIPGTCLTVLYHISKGKQTGHDRLWIHLRQPTGKKVWRSSAVLSYPRATDLAFVKE